MSQVERSSVSHVLRFSAVLTVAGLSAATALAVRMGIESRTSEDRGRFLVAQVREHQASLDRNRKRLVSSLFLRVSGEARRMVREVREIEAAIPADQIMTEGRRAHAQAVGYAKVDRNIDSAFLYVASARSLLMFVERFPTDTDVPEALFLIGKSLLGLRPYLSGSLRGDSVLSLCMELFPESVWATRSRMLWLEEIGPGAKTQFVRGEI